MSEKFNILIVHNYYKIPGGEDTVVRNEINLLKENGHDVYFYSRNNSELRNFSVWKKFTLPFSTIFNIGSYRDIKKIIQQNDIDIVHVHNTLNLISPSVYYASLSCGVPVVQTIHNFRLLCPGATLYRDGHVCEDCITKGLFCAIKHRCYRNNRMQTTACVLSTVIHRIISTYKRINYICLTEFNKKKLLELKSIEDSQVYVKPNFFFENEFTNLNISGKRTGFIYAGRLDSLKGIPILFEAWNYMGNSAPKLIVCGKGPLENWCKEYVRVNQNCNIELMGYVDNFETKKLMASAQALILPTQWYEGFPMTILEAFSVGTPVIGSDIGNVGCLIQEGLTGWKFKHDSFIELAEIVRKAEKAELIVNTSSISKFSATNNYIQLMEIYEKVRGKL